VAVVLLVVVIVLTLQRLVELSWLRPRVVAALGEATGRPVEIAALHVRLVPRPRIVLRGLRLGSPPGFGGTDLVTVDAVRVKVAVRPLLRGALRVSNLELDEPRLVIADDGHGATNLDFASASGGNSGGVAASAFAGIDEVTIRDAEVTLATVAGENRTVVPGLRVRHVDARVTGLTFDRPISAWTAEADLEDATLELADVPGPIAATAGRVTLAGGRAEGKFDGRLGEAGAFAGTLLVEEIARPVVTFDLAFPDLNLAALPAVPFVSLPVAVPPGQPSELLSSGRLRAERLRLPPYEAGKFSADISVLSDRVEIKPLSFLLYGGAGEATITLDQRVVPARLAARLNVADVDLARLLDASPATRGAMTGRGELKVRLTAALADDVAATLGGTGTFACRNGAFPGIDLGAALVALVKERQGVAAAAFKGATPYRELTGDLAIRDRRVASRAVHMDCDLGTVDLSGSLGFDGSLDYRGTAVLERSASGVSTVVDAAAIALGQVVHRRIDRVSVPFALGGTVDDMKLRPAGVPSVATAGRTPLGSAVSRLFNRIRRK
jgi:uncharacterized protein involved in outer membrane biogenesis